MEKSSWVFAIVVVGILVGITAFLIVNPLVFISAGERGVVLRWGAVTDSVSIP